MLLLWAAALAVAYSQPANFPFEAQVDSVLKQTRDWTFDEDFDEASFGIDGKEPLPNFGQVAPGLYRSGQPNREGIARAAKLGVKTLLVIRKKVGAEERAEAERLGLRIESVPMSGFFSPSFGNVDRALKIINDPAKQPVLVHCRFGKDRTGVTVGAYRTALQRMAVAEAVTEAKSYGCCAPLFFPLKPYLERYLKHRD